MRRKRWCVCLAERAVVHDNAAFGEAIGEPAGGIAADRVDRQADPRATGRLRNTPGQIVAVDQHDVGRAASQRIGLVRQRHELLACGHDVRSPGADADGQQHRLTHRKRAAIAALGGNAADSFVAAHCRKRRQHAVFAGQREHIGRIDRCRQHFDQNLTGLELGRIELDRRDHILGNRSAAFVLGFEHRFLLALSVQSAARSYHLQAAHATKPAAPGDDAPRSRDGLRRGMVAAVLTALDHVIVAVRALDGAEADYQRLLGLAPSWKGVHPDWGTANVLFRTENCYLELIAPSGGGPFGHVLRSWLDAYDDGMIGLGFATDDIDRCVAELTERGMSPGPVESGHGRDDATGAERHWRRANLPADRTRGLFLFPIQHDSPADTLPMAPVLGDPAASVHGLDHVVVQTTNVEAARKLYRDALGLRLAVDREFPEWGVHLMFFRIGGLTVEVATALAATDVAAPIPGATATALQDRLYGMSYRVRSIEAARDRLATAGVDVSEVRRGRRPGTRVITVRSSTRNVPTLMIEFDKESV